MEMAERGLIERLWFPVPAARILPTTGPWRAASWTPIW